MFLEEFKRSQKGTLAQNGLITFKICGKIVPVNEHFTDFLG